MQLRLLGPTEFIIGDVRARLGGPRSRAVLGDLGLHAGRPVMIPQIIDDLWGDSPPPSAAHTVETYISRLRKVLNLPGEPIVIARNGSGYVLNLDSAPSRCPLVRRTRSQGPNRARRRRHPERRRPAFVCTRALAGPGFRRRPRFGLRSRGGRTAGE